eukprot:1077861-Pleurochrysis_carterae.AAC.2
MNSGRRGIVGKEREGGRRENAVGALGLQHPPVLGTKHLTRDIHNDVAQREKQTRGERFGKEICQVVRTANKGDRELELFDLLAYEEVSSMDMFRSRVVLWVVREVDGKFVVKVERGSAVHSLSQLVEECMEIRGFFRGLGSRDVSASQEESATVGCFLQLHVMAALP